MVFIFATILLKVDSGNGVCQLFCDVQFLLDVLLPKSRCNYQPSFMGLYPFEWGKYCPGDV